MSEIDQEEPWRCPECRQPRRSRGFPISIDQPITTTELRTIIKHQVRGERQLKAEFRWSATKSSWFVSAVWIEVLKHDAYFDTFLLLEHTERDGSPSDIPVLLTKRGEPKFYKSIDTLYRDMKSLSGGHVVLEDDTAEVI